MHYIILATCFVSSLAGIIYNIFRHKNNINIIYSTIWGSIFIVSLANIINRINDDFSIISYVFAICIETVIILISMSIKRKKNQP